MTKITFLGEKYEAEKIVKTSDSIIGYNDGKEVFSFKGITDFSFFKLVKGEYITDGIIEEETEEEKTAELLRIEALEKEAEKLRYEKMIDKQHIEANEKEIAALWYEIAVGGM